jgi:hypothetical protein
MEVDKDNVNQAAPPGNHNAVTETVPEEMGAEQGDLNWEQVFKLADNLNGHPSKKDATQSSTNPEGQADMI